MAGSIRAHASRLFTPVAIVLAIAMSFAGGTAPRRAAGHGRERAPRASRSAAQRLDADHGVHGSADADGPVLSQGDDHGASAASAGAPESAAALIGGLAQLDAPVRFTCLILAPPTHVPAVPACASLSDRAPPLS